ncbi:MAG: AAA family ATPase [bacterium]
MAFRPPIGFSDFRRIREDGMTYVDKTSVVQRVLATTSAVFLLPRPRRFGKTLNLTTLRCFLEKSPHDFSRLFEGLQVWDDPEARAHFQRYPVVFLSFKDVKFRSWPECLASVARQVALACGEHREVLEGATEQDRARFEALLDEKAEVAGLANALALLTRLLAAHHGEQVVLLIDEYDTPIHAGYVSSYYDEVVTFFRVFLSAGLKDNVHLFKGVITGILRIAKENLFSGLNNLQVFGLQEQPFATDFGFTEEEVAELARLASAEQHGETMRAWYDGYRFADHVIYNPWSILSFLADPVHEARAHWVMTSSNDLLYEALRGGLEHPADIEALLAGGAVEREVADSMVLRDLVPGSAAVWTLLFHSGYVTATGLHQDELGVRTLTLRIPNLEVRTAYRSIFARYLGGLDANRARTLRGALFHGDAETLGLILSDTVREVLSYFDLDPVVPERVYHAFLAGLLVNLAPHHEVRSNRESGYGRYDVMVLPRTPGQPGAVMELKALRGKDTVPQALEKAARQLVDRQYATELRARGADPIHGFAVVFDGKQVHVESVEV